jgi:hypothetical protein
MELSRSRRRGMEFLTKKELNDQLERIGVYAPSEASSISRDYRGYCIERYIHENDSFLRKCYKRFLLLMNY